MTFTDTIVVVSNIKNHTRRKQNCCQDFVCIIRENYSLTSYSIRLIILNK